MKGLVSYIQESGAFAISFVEMVKSTRPGDQEVCMQAVLCSIQLAKKGNKHANAVK